MNRIRLEFPFPHDYDADLTGELPPGPGQMRTIYFPGASETGGRDGLLVTVTPTAATPWIGVFAGGYDSSGVVSGVFGCPDRRSICVVSSGKGYIVRADDPAVWMEVHSFPIMDVRAMPESQLLVFANFTTLAAYGPNGLVWVTGDLSWDGLKLTEATPELIRGIAWDAPHEREVEFVVDVRTGGHEGGSSPEGHGST
jgi:hypothetical protein